MCFGKEKSNHINVAIGDLYTVLGVSLKVMLRCSLTHSYRAVLQLHTFVSHSNISHVLKIVRLMLVHFVLWVYK